MSRGARRDGKVRYVNSHGHVEWLEPRDVETLRRMDAAAENRNFSHELTDGTTIYGNKDVEGRPGHDHGHAGDDFHRGPHSTIGSAALDDPHTAEEHRKNRTERW